LRNSFQSRLVRGSSSGLNTASISTLAVRIASSSLEFHSRNGTGGITLKSEALGLQSTGFSNGNSTSNERNSLSFNSTRIPTLTNWISVIPNALLLLWSFLDDDGT